MKGDERMRDGWVLKIESFFLEYLKSTVLEAIEERGRFVLGESAYWKNESKLPENIERGRQFSLECQDLSDETLTLEMRFDPGVFNYILESHGIPLVFGLSIAIPEGQDHLIFHSKSDLRVFKRIKLKSFKTDRENMEQMADDLIENFDSLRFLGTLKS